MTYTAPQVILNSTSSGTGTACFVGDARLLSLSIQSSVDSASRYTISLSNDNGFQSAIAEASWSVATTIVSRGVFTIDPGARWLRAEQPAIALGSAASAVTITLQRYFE